MDEGIEAVLRGQVVGSIGPQRIRPNQRAVASQNSECLVYERRRIPEGNDVE
jgi:hypothetical protein